MSNPCITCKFYKRSGFFSVRGALCLNSRCKEAAWTYYDPVSGEKTHYESRPEECYKARWDKCLDGRHWESKE